jgi:hypothetical protein
VTVAKVQLCSLDIRLIKLHGALILLHDIELILRLLLRNGIRCCQSLVPFEVDLHFLENGPIVRLLGNRLVEGRLIGTWIDQKQRLAFLHVLARRSKEFRSTAEIQSRTLRGGPINSG